MAVDGISAVLLKNTSLTEGQILQLLALKSQDGRPIADHLAQKNLTVLEDILKALAAELGIEYMKEIPANDISVELVRDIPVNYAKQYGVLPFKSEIDHVKVLTSNPADYKVLDAI